MVKWSKPGKGVGPPLHLSVVAIEKGAFWLPLTTVANLLLTLVFWKDQSNNKNIIIFSDSLV